MCVKTGLAGLMRNSLSFKYRSFILKTGIRKEAERDTCHWIKVPDCTHLSYKRKLFLKKKYTHANAQSLNTEKKKQLNTVIHWHSVHLVKTCKHEHPYVTCIKGKQWKQGDKKRHSQRWCPWALLSISINTVHSSPIPNSCDWWLLDTGVGGEGADPPTFLSLFISGREWNEGTYSYISSRTLLWGRSKIRGSVQ